jgi:hypothetical protein
MKLIIISKTPSKVKIVQINCLQPHLIGQKEVSLDCLMLLIIIALFIIEAFCQNPVLAGFLRLRCLLRFPFMYILVFTSCGKKVRIHLIVT